MTRSLARRSTRNGHDGEDDTGGAIAEHAPNGSTVGGRIREAFHLHRLTKLPSPYFIADFARDIAVAEGREKPYAPTAVSEWISGRSEPRISVFRAIEAVVGVRAAWMMLNEGGIWAESAVSRGRRLTQRLDTLTDVETLEPATRARPKIAPRHHHGRTA